MQLTNAPGKLTLPFATSGAKNVIPVPSQIPITPGAASWTDGFPPLTMTALFAGGISPSGLDFNGILNALSALSVWFNAGAGFTYDSTFATAVGGYPTGARLLRADRTGYWLNSVDNNLTNPDTGGAGWAPNRAISSVYASSQQTLAVGQSKIIFDSTEFDDGLWDATARRFVAPYGGRYRMSGAVQLSTPGAQLLGAAIYKNGAALKQCWAFPQVGDTDLILTFEGIANLVPGDYLDAYVNVNQTPVLAGVVGSNQTRVYAQLEYLG